jgi:hypothetical protein
LVAAASAGFAPKVIVTFAPAGSDGTVHSSSSPAAFGVTVGSGAPAPSNLAVPGT